MKITLREPNGQIQKTPDLNYLKGLILNADISYWRVGSGDLGIDYSNGKTSSIMLIYCAEVDGFYIEYLPEKGSNIYDPLVSINNSNIIREVTLSVGGGKFKVPLQTIVSRENTFRAIDHFINTGTNFDRIKWAKQSQIDWPIEEELE